MEIIPVFDHCLRSHIFPETVTQNPPQRFRNVGVENSTTVDSLHILLRCTQHVEEHRQEKTRVSVFGSCKRRENGEQNVQNASIIPNRTHQQSHRGEMLGNATICRPFEGVLKEVNVVGWQVRYRDFRLSFVSDTVRREIQNVRYI